MVPLNKNIVIVDRVKLLRHQEKAGQIDEMRQAAVQVVLVVVGALGTISRNISTLWLTDIIGSAEVTALLGNSQLMY